MFLLPELSEALEPHSRRRLQLLLKRIDFDTQRLQRRDTEQRLRVFVSEKRCTSHDLAHEFDSRDGNIHADFSTALQLIRPLRRKRICGIGDSLIAKSSLQFSCLAVRHYTLSYRRKTTENGGRLMSPHTKGQPQGVVPTAT